MNAAKSVSEAQWGAMNRGADWESFPKRLSSQMGLAVELPRRKLKEVKLFQN